MTFQTFYARRDRTCQIFSEGSAVSEAAAIHTA